MKLKGKGLGVKRIEAIQAYNGNSDLQLSNAVIVINGKIYYSAIVGGVR